VAEHAEHLDPVVELIEDEEPAMTFEGWLAMLEEREPIDLGVSAAELLSEARQAGEV
jgi:hypothetical protein